MKLGLLSALLFTACATTGSTMETREPAARANVQLDLTATAEERAVFPQAQDPQLPSVDRIARDIRARLGDEVIASIDLCVAADGHVTKITLVEGSGYDAFDVAMLRDAKEWQFASLPGATAKHPLQTCERARVKYLAP